MLSLICAIIYFFIIFAFSHAFLADHVAKVSVFETSLITNHGFTVVIVFFSFIIMGAVIANLAEFSIDRQNLIFIISKHYKGINYLFERIIAIFVVVLCLDVFYQTFI